MALAPRLCSVWVKMAEQVTLLSQLSWCAYLVAPCPVGHFVGPLAGAAAPAAPVPLQPGAALADAPACQCLWGKLRQLAGPAVLAGWAQPGFACTPVSLPRPP